MSTTLFNLKRPLIFFDIESTGTDVAKDRIVELSMIKYYGKDESESKLWRVNPGIPIPREASLVHGIYDADVANEPRFFELVNEVHTFIKDADLGGYNILKFDVPLLAEEMLRCGIQEPFAADVNFVDVFKIFTSNERRDLSSAYRFYCNKEMQNAHNAEADNQATIEVFRAQMNKYGLTEDLKALANEYGQGEILDYAGRFARNEQNEIVFTFGKNAGLRAIDQPGMLQWMLDRDFPEHTKYIARKILNKELS